jgi:hypothetical protein
MSPSEVSSSDASLTNRRSQTDSQTKNAQVQADSDVARFEANHGIATNFAVGAR